MISGQERHNIWNDSTLKYRSCYPCSTNHLNLLQDHLKKESKFHSKNSNNNRNRISTPSPEASGLEYSWIQAGEPISRALPETLRRRISK